MLSHNVCRLLKALRDETNKKKTFRTRSQLMYLLRAFLWMHQFFFHHQPSPVRGGLWITNLWTCNLGSKISQTPNLFSFFFFRDLRNCKSSRPFDILITSQGPKNLHISPPCNGKKVMRLQNQDLYIYFCKKNDLLCSLEFPFYNDAYNVRVFFAILRCVHIVVVATDIIVVENLMKKKSFYLY
jgi:hypothetical protein